MLYFGDTSDKLNGEHLGMYYGDKSEVSCTTKFDENSDLSTMYLDRIVLCKAGCTMLQSSRGWVCIMYYVYEHCTCTMHSFRVP